MSTYRIGTVTVSNGSTSVTGSGTAWVSAGVREGDFLFVNGLFGEIASVQSNTALTLVRGWPGSGASGQQYSIALIDDGQRSIASLNQVLAALGQGTLTSLASLNGAANEMPYWTGAGVMGKTALTAGGRAILGLAGAAGASIPVFTGTGTASRRDIVGTVSQSAGVPTGAIIQRGSNANGEFIRFADGTQICTLVGFVLPFNNTTSCQADWVLPAAFTGTPNVSATINVSATATSAAPALDQLLAPTWANSGTNATVTRISVRRVSGATNFVSGNTVVLNSIMAVGRWF